MKARKNTWMIKSININFSLDYLCFKIWESKLLQSRAVDGMPAEGQQSTRQQYVYPHVPPDQRMTARAMATLPSSQGLSFSELTWSKSTILLCYLADRLFIIEIFVNLFLSLSVILTHPKVPVFFYKGDDYLRNK